MTIWYEFFFCLKSFELTNWSPEEWEKIDIVISENVVRGGEIELNPLAVPYVDLNKAGHTRRHSSAGYAVRQLEV